MDGYVFLRDVSEATIRVLADLTREGDGKGDTRIRAVAGLTGEYDAVVFVEAGNGAQLQELVLDQIRNQAGAAFTETAVAVEVPLPISGGAAPPNGGTPPPIPLGPKRRLVATQEALALVKTDPGTTVDVFWRLAEALGDGLLGEAIVTGQYDIVVELGAESYAELSSYILSVGMVDHVVSTETALANFVAAP